MNFSFLEKRYIQNYIKSERITFFFEKTKNLCTFQKFVFKEVLESMKKCAHIEKINIKNIFTLVLSNFGLRVPQTFPEKMIFSTEYKI